MGKNNCPKTLTFPTSADNFNEFYRLQLMRPSHCPGKNWAGKENIRVALYLYGWCSYSKPKITISILSNLRNTPEIATVKNPHQCTGPFDNRKERNLLWLSMCSMLITSACFLLVCVNF